MKIKTGREKLDQFIGQADRDSDVYMLAHFSRSEDKYQVYYTIDAGDALMLVRDMCKRFNIDALALHEMLNED